MAFEYIGDLLEEAVRDVNPLETRSRWWAPSSVPWSPV